MASMTYSKKLTESKYNNWVKAGLAVLFTKEGIQPLVHDEIEQFQQKCLTDICNKNGLPVGTTCSSCCTENLIVCNTSNRICKVRQGDCCFHRIAALQYKPAGCSNGICKDFETHIQKAHRYRSPSYRNTDATQWCSNPWEVAKCFMPADGYKGVSSATETDFNGIISVVMNYKEFQTKVHDINVFDKGRDIGKAVRHSPTLEMEDTELQQYFTELNNLLLDPGYLATNADAQKARQKLSQLQNDTLIIGKDDVRKMLNDVAKAIQEKIRTEGDQEAEKQKLQLINTTKQSLNDIKGQENISISELRKEFAKILTEGQVAVKTIRLETDRAVQEISASTNKSFKMVETEADTGVKTIILETDNAVQQINVEREEGVHEIQNEVDAGAKKISSKADEALLRIDKKLRTGDEQSENVRYNKLKKEFKDDLVTFNNKRHSSIPLSPLFEVMDTSLIDFYVMPDMFTCVRKERTPVKSLKEVFFKQEEKCNEIYITADAGIGKTAFSKRLVMTWCQAQRPKKSKNGYFSPEDVSTMKHFEFLFLVSLRDAEENCNIDDMIMKQILQHMALRSHYKEHYLEKILSRHPCLIILDGLDEWIHATSSTCTKGKSQIPHRNERKDTTIVTTTRPWKLSVLNIKNSEIDRTIELVGLNKVSQRKLKINAISKIKDKNRDEIAAQIQKFDDDVKPMALNDFQDIPLLLLFMICLWSDGKKLGRSMSDFYSRVIELLLSKSVKTFKMEPRKAHSSNTPKCFMEQKTCLTYCKFLTDLGVLAFQTLFSSTRENTLVFDNAVAKRFLSEEYLDSSLKSGILTQSKEQGLTSQRSKVSFAHKSMQEFFAALHIYHTRLQDNTLKSVQSVCKDIDSILQMKMVFSFLSGISLRYSERLFQMILDVVSTDSRTQQYRSCSFIWNYNVIQPLKSIQNMYIDVLVENTQNGEDATCLHLQDFIIDTNCKDAKYYSALKTLYSRNKSNIKSICIKAIEGFPDINQVIRDYNLRDTQGLEKVFYRSDTIGDEVNMLLNGSLNTLQYLAVISHKWDEYISCRWPDDLSGHLENMQHLKGIAFDGFVMTHSQLEKLMDYLKQKTSLLEVSLYNLKCAEHVEARNCCRLDMSNNTGLKFLRLTSIPLSDLDISVSSLELCDVGNLEIITKYLQQLLKAHNLKTFLCSFQESPSDIDVMLKMLPMLGSLKVIKLRKINVSERTITLPSAIEKVILMDVTIKSSSLKRLIETLEGHKQSVTVEIKGCTIVPGEGFDLIKKDIRKSDFFVVKEDRLDVNRQHCFVFETESDGLFR